MAIELSFSGVSKGHSIYQRLSIWVNQYLIWNLDLPEDSRIALVTLKFGREIQNLLGNSIATFLKVAQLRSQGVLTSVADHEAE